MKKFKFGPRKLALAVILFINIFAYSNISAAPLHFEPVTKSLPDGTMINLFISGDEFFNYLHDANEFPVGEGADGYYYYFIQEGDNFILTTNRYATSDPFMIKGLRKVSIPSYVNEKRKAFLKNIDDESVRKGVKSLNKSSGVFNNLVIYIRFLNEPEFTVQRSVYETRLNSLASSSMRFYYKEISYDKLDVISYSFPGGSTTDISYTDKNPRSYYRAYDALSNTNGYRNETEKTTREHSLLASAIYWTKAQYTLPAGVNFDVNQDGIIDNICFIVKGISDGWNDLLWPHRWALYTQSVKLGGLNVYGYTLQLENVSVNTLCHEMFHALGAPDLYHYDNSLRPVGPWDIMAEGRGHPGAWMKYRYGGWIDEIPEIKASGTYVLKPLSQEKKNVYKIKSPYQNDQFFIVEYRNMEGYYESSLPSSGMIIQRVNPSVKGNASGPPDEIYIFRVSGTTETEGELNIAAFSNITGRTSFNDNTNPRAFFMNGHDTGIDISNIRIEGDSMLFTVDIELPVELVLTSVEDTKISAKWKCLSANDFLVVASTTPETITPIASKVYLPGDTIGEKGFVVQNGPEKKVTQPELTSDEIYYFTVWTITGKAPFNYSAPVKASQRTGIYTILDLPHVEKFDGLVSELPRGWKALTGKEGWELYQTDDLTSPNSLLLLNPSHGAEEWIYSPGFLLLENKKYMITFRYRNKTKSVKESLFLGGGTTRYNNGLNQYNLFAANDFDYSKYSIFKSVFVSALSTTYYFGFKTGTMSHGVIIDDFRIEEVPAATIQHSEPEQFYPNPTNGPITVPVTGDTKITVFKTDGTRIYDTSIESMQEIDLSFLGKGMFLIRFTTSEKTITRKIIIL